MHTQTAVLWIDSGLQKVLEVRDVEEQHTQSVLHHHSCSYLCIPDCSLCADISRLSADHL